METGTASTSARILVVEDERLVALDIQSSLQRLGYDAVVAFSAQGAIDTALAQQVDLVLMDIKLDGVDASDGRDGIDAATVIRRETDIPVIYLTAFADEQTLERARQTCPYGYVLKPFQERELEAMIEVTLVRRRRELRQADDEAFQRALADATERLTATLDPESVARVAVDLIVPRYADYCVVHVAQRSDELPELLVVAPRMKGAKRGADAPGPLLERVRITEATELVTDIGPTPFHDIIAGATADILETIKPRSILCVPLEARGVSIGALAVVSGATRPAIDYAGMAFITDYAFRVANALENALLYGALSSARRVRDEIVATISHGLRTPLGIIMLETDSIAGDSHAAHAPHAEKIARATRRMNRMVGDMLDAAGIEGDGIRLETRMCGVASLVDETLDMFRSEAEELSIVLRRELAFDVDRCSCDRDRIIQVLSDLLDSAFKVTPPDGAITLSADRVSEGIRFGVRKSSNVVATDDGLGLAVARSILRAHHSSLLLVADPEGHQFSFVLPA